MWCSLFLYSSRGYQDAEATEKHKLFWADRRNDGILRHGMSYVIYGWPFEEKRETVLKSFWQKRSLGSYGPILAEERQKAFNYVAWLAIAIFTFMHAFQIASSSSFPSLKIGLGTLLKLFLLYSFAWHTPELGNGIQFFLFQSRSASIVVLPRQLEELSGYQTTNATHGGRVQFK